MIQTYSHCNIVTFLHFPTPVVSFQTHTVLGRLVKKRQEHIFSRDRERPNRPTCTKVVMIKKFKYKDAWVVGHWNNLFKITVTVKMRPKQQYQEENIAKKLHFTSIAI